MKVVIVLFLLVILYCLGSGVFFLVRANSKPEQLAKALTWRIVLSFCLFVLILFAYLMGWITPHSVAV